jgi:hypothetical protein
MNRDDEIDGIYLQIRQGEDIPAAATTIITLAG